MSTARKVTTICSAVVILILQRFDVMAATREQLILFSNSEIQSKAGKQGDDDPAAARWHGLQPRRGDRDSCSRSL